jgi:hypothetical protein
MLCDGAVAAVGVSSDCNRVDSGGSGQTSLVVERITVTRFLFN